MTWIKGIKMDKNAPPPVIYSARLLAYAIVDGDVKFTNKIKLFVGDKRLEKVPNLAICESLGKDKKILLFFCNAQWEVLGTIAKNSAKEARQQAEVGYDGISAKWIEHETSIEDAEKYLDISGTGGESAFAKDQCTFCKKSSGDVERLYGTEEAVICNECIEEFYKYVQEDKNSK